MVFFAHWLLAVALWCGPVVWQVCVGGDEDRDGPDASLSATVEVERGPQALDSTVLVGPGKRGL